MKHGLDKDGPSYASDFGTIAAFGPSVANTTSTYTYIAMRAAIFFQMILNGVAGGLNPSIFIDCANLRYIKTVSGSCSIQNNNVEACSNSDVCP